MKKTLIAGFKGKSNSSKILLDKILNSDKLYLENDFKISEDQLTNQLDNKDYDEIIIFGQKPLIKNIYIELSAKRENLIVSTNYNYDNLIKFLNKNNYKTKISDTAGYYLCNNIYFYALHFLKIKQIIFIHIPTLRNIEDIDDLSKVLSEFLKIY